VNVLYLSYDGLLDPLGHSQILPYLEGLSVLGHRFDVLTFEKPVRWDNLVERQRVQRRVSDAGIRWHPRRYHKRFSLGATVYDLASALFLSNRVVRSRRPDFLHARSYPPAVVARAVAKRARLPYLFDMRGLYPEERVEGDLWPADGTLFRVTKHVERLLLRDAAGVVTLTEASVPVIQGLMDRAGSSARLDVIPTAVDLDRFTPTSPQGPPSLCYFGSIGTWYMLDEMLAFGRAAVEATGARLKLLLNDSADAVRPVLRRAGLRDADVEIASVPYERVPSALAGVWASYAFIRPVTSKVASAATKVSESLALGLPVAVNPGVGDAADIVAREGVGVVVDPRATHSFPEAARRLMDLAGDEEVRSRCRRVAEERFNLKTAVSLYDRLYASLARTVAYRQ
jgi:glycosyltransferase involved in cell wall biosynthesis